MTPAYAAALCAWVAVGDKVRPFGERATVVQPQLVQAYVMRYNQRRSYDFDFTDGATTYQSHAPIILSPFRNTSWSAQNCESVRRIIHQQQDNV